MNKEDKAAPASRFGVDHEAIEAAVHNAFGIEIRQALASHVSHTPGEIEQMLLNFKSNIRKAMSEGGWTYGGGNAAKESLADKDSRIEALEAENKKLQGGELAKKDATIKTLTDRVAEMGQGYEAHKLANMTDDEKRAANNAPTQVVDPNPAPYLGYTTMKSEEQGGQALHGHGPQVKDYAGVVHHNVVGDPTSPATAREDAELRKTAGVRSDGTYPGQPPLHASKTGHQSKADDAANRKAMSEAEMGNDLKGRSGFSDRGPSQHELGPAPGKGEAPKLPAKDQPAKKDTK